MTDILETPTETATRKDIYEKITQNIIDDLEKGELTWRKPWNSEHLKGSVCLPLRWNDIPYSGINTLVLWAAGAEYAYRSPYWMTYKQAMALKAIMRPNEKPVRVVHVDHFTKEEDSETEWEEKKIKKIPFLKVYYVFNAEQFDGLPEHYYTPSHPKISNPDKRVMSIEEYFKETKAEITEGADAKYMPTLDRIEMPPYETFVDAVNYYATLSHEVAHWTKHPSRLNRDFNQKKWGDEGYAIEELVAELSACFLGAELGFEPILKKDHSAYIQSWLKVLKNDKRFIVQAASHAQRAVSYLNNLQSK